MKGKLYSDFQQEFVKDISDINPQLQASFTARVDKSIQRMEKTDIEKMVEKLEIITWQIAITNILISLLVFTVLKVGN